MRLQLLRHLPYLESEADLDAYTYEARNSRYPGARSDIFVYDGHGRLVIQGRDFHAGPMAFWLPDTSIYRRPDK